MPLPYASSLMLRQTAATWPAHPLNTRKPRQVRLKLKGFDQVLESGWVLLQGKRGIPSPQVSLG